TSARRSSRFSPLVGIAPSVSTGKLDRRINHKKILELPPAPEAIPSSPMMWPNLLELHTSMDCERGSDRYLTESFRAGDRDAFTGLYRTHFPAVFRFAFYMTGDRIKAAEITQDVFVWLIHHPGEFDPERGDLATFLGGVARNLLRRRQRSERRWLPFVRLEAHDSGGPA